MSEDSEKILRDLTGNDILKAAELIAAVCPATLIADALFEELANTSRPNETLRLVLHRALRLGMESSDT